MAALSLAVLDNFWQFLVKSFFDHESLLLDMNGTVGEVLLFNFLDFGYHSELTFKNLALVELFLGELAHHICKLDKLLPVLCYLLA